MKPVQQNILDHQVRLSACRRCPDMLPPVVCGQAVAASVMLVGQAPGGREGDLGRPFAWTAGKTLFKWFSGIGVEEERFRSCVYMAAVCRCFPGKNPKGGDRVPSKLEIQQCSHWLDAEFAMLRPRLIIPVGKLAISQFLPLNRLTEVIGHRFQWEGERFESDIIPLPHPSGASTWHRSEPGKTLLQEALQEIQRHPAWREIVPSRARQTEIG